MCECNRIFSSIEKVADRTLLHSPLGKFFMMIDKQKHAVGQWQSVHKQLHVQCSCIGCGIIDTFLFSQTQIFALAMQLCWFVTF